MRLNCDHALAAAMGLGFLRACQAACHAAHKIFPSVQRLRGFIISYESVLCQAYFSVGPTATQRALDFTMSIQHLWFYTLLLAHLSSAANKCYFPNGSPSTDEPCDPNALFTQCCGSASKCLSNGVCLVEVKNFVGDETTGTQYARGTCTDRTWVSSLCPQQCLVNQDTARNQSAYDFAAGGVQVWQCTGQGFAAEAKYCCESQGEQQRCCQTQSVVFPLQGAVRGASTTNTLGQTTDSSASTTASIASTTASVALTRASIASTTAPIASKSAPTTASVATTSATGQPHGTNKAKMTGIAVGVGVGVGLIFLIAGVVFVVRRHKLKERNRGMSEPSVGELHGSAVSKYPVEVWTQPAEMWTQPQELPADTRLDWEMPTNPQTPRQA
jgi:hypothetical protein